MSFKRLKIIAEIYKKIVAVTKDIHVGEVMEFFQDIMAKTKEHQNTKIVQGTELQANIKLPNKHVLLIDYAKLASELQNETMGALEMHRAVNLFKYDVCHN